MTEQFEHSLQERAEAVPDVVVVSPDDVWSAVRRRRRARRARAGLGAGALVLGVAAAATWSQVTGPSVSSAPVAVAEDAAPTTPPTTDPGPHVQAGDASGPFAERTTAGVAPLSSSTAGVTPLSSSAYAAAAASGVDVDSAHGDCTAVVAGAAAWVRDTLPFPEPVVAELEADWLERRCAP